MDRTQEKIQTSEGGTKARGRKPLLKDLHDHIVCQLCSGYLVDATTLVECLHSFCRGCIIRRLLAGPKVCPVCNINASAAPIANVGLQRMIYLVVPGLYKSELERRRHFNQVNPQCINLNQPPLGAPALSFDDLVSLSLCEVGAQTESSIRYLKCPAGVTVRHLLRLLMLKRGWSNTNDTNHQLGNKIELMYEKTESGTNDFVEILNPSWTLMDLAYIYEWKREAPMKLLYRITQADDLTSRNPSNVICNNTVNNNNNTTSISIDTSIIPTTPIARISSNQGIENIQRPPTPPPSPKPTISCGDDTVKNSQSSVSASTTIVDQYSKDHEPKKPLCEVTPVMRAPDPPVINERPKSKKLPKLEHQHKRKKRRNKRVIAEITTTPREDLLKLKVRLTPRPPRITSSNSSEDQKKEKLTQIKSTRKEKTKSSSVKEQPTIPLDEEETMLEDVQNIKKAEAKKDEHTADVVDHKSSVEKSNKGFREQEHEELPNNQEVLRKLGLVAINETSKCRPEKMECQVGSNTEQTNPEVEREKLEKQLRESKANRVRSLLAEKQMRDTLKSIMSKETSSVSLFPNSTGASSTSGSSGSCSTATIPTAGNVKRKEPPPLTPLRNAKRSNVTFASCSFAGGKYESPLDLSSPSNVYKDKVLDLSSNVSELVTMKSNSKDKSVSLSRTTSNRWPIEKPKEEAKKTHDSNLRTLSDAAVSLLGDRSLAQVEKSTKLNQRCMAGSGSDNPSASGKVALRIPQLHQRLTGFGMKMKPNIGVRHIPNPQAVVASQYRNQRTSFFNFVRLPP